MRNGSSRPYGGFPYPVVNLLPHFLSWLNGLALDMDLLQWACIEMRREQGAKQMDVG